MRRKQPRPLPRTPNLDKGVFRRSPLRLLQDHGTSDIGRGSNAQCNPDRQVAKGLEINNSCLRHWVSLNDVAAGRNEFLTGAEHKKPAGVRRRSRLLEMEIAKCASTCFGKK